MKWNLLVLILAAAVIASQALLPIQDDGKDIPATVKIMKNLHRAPPAPKVQSRAMITENWIEQKLDNFDPSETRTWQMRYLENPEFWQSGGPIFIYFGGEWEISPGMLLGGHLYDMAREHKAMLYYTEHRYYGWSRPLPDTSPENLKWLDVKQALADIAHFIRTKRQSVPGMANSKVIISGGSYSASMVVWFKLLYPDLVDGGWASSAPLLAKVDFREYKEVVGRAYRELGSEQCYNRIKNGVAAYEAMFANKRAAEAKAMLKVCNNFREDNDLDVWMLFGSISNIFAGIAQYQTPESGDIEYVCDWLMQYDDDAVALGSFVVWLYGSRGCIDFSYKSSLTFYLDTKFEMGESRPWYYQTCNEYGWYQSSASRDQPFGTKFPALLYTFLCEDIFGSKFTNENIQLATARTNELFLGQDVRVENIYETHGALDPWHPMGHGVAENATLIPKTSHCQDFDSISPWDSAEMRASKLKLAELVRQWLGVSSAAADKL